MVIVEWKGMVATIIAYKRRDGVDQKNTNEITCCRLLLESSRTQ